MTPDKTYERDMGTLPIIPMVRSFARYVAVKLLPIDWAKGDGGRGIARQKTEI